jgi:predicted nucleic acid-binding protein
MATRNVALTMPEDLFRQAKIYSAEHHTSVSKLVTDLLTGMLASRDGYERIWAEDLNPGQKIEGVTVTNPFASQNRTGTPMAQRPHGAVATWCGAARIDGTVPRW